MIIKYKNAPIQWLFWHPHQRLWNWTLVSLIKKVIFIKPIAGLFIKSIVYLDTFLLALNLKLKPKNVSKSGYSSNKTINYFDLGTHKDANELNWVVENVLSKLTNPYKVYAFEANPDSYDIAVSKITHIKNLKFFNIALANKIPESGYVNLYKFGDGLGDSIYRIDKNSSFIAVPAKRLSDVIKGENIELSKCINILRMNIEGCEFDVIEDLLANDFVKYFDGFYGMWDDVSKIDFKRDKKFRNLLKKARIYPYPFNGRDMNKNTRKNLIKQSLEYSILGKAKTNNNSISPEGN